MNVSGDIFLTVIYESTTWGKHTVTTIKVAVSNREEIEDQGVAGLRYLGIEIVHAAFVLFKVFAEDSDIRKIGIEFRLFSHR